MITEIVNAQTILAFRGFFEVSFFFKSDRSTNWSNFHNYKSGKQYTGTNRSFLILDFKNRIAKFYQNNFHPVH